MNNRKRKFSLQQYSGMAGVLLLMHSDLSAQAIYTDIDPDIVLQFDDETTGVDMDNDGDFDFAFLKLSYYWTSTFSTDYEFRHALWCGPYGSPENEIAGESVTNGAGGGTSYFPFAFESGSLINNGLDFQYWGYQKMGSGFYDILSSDWIWHYDNGFWSPNIDSSYLGVRFIGSDECRHYGWIRCSTVDSAKTLIIHDYAYEMKCETSIKAGDIVGDTNVVVEEINTLNAMVYSFGNIIYIKLNEQLKDTEIRVFDIMGKEIFFDEVINQFSQIELTESKGIYFVELISAEKKYTKKIFIN